MRERDIIGAGGLAREVYFLINEINKHNRQYNFKGFIDYNPEFIPAIFPDEESFGSLPFLGLAIGYSFGNTSLAPAN